MSGPPDTTRPHENINPPSDHPGNPQRLEEFRSHARQEERQRYQNDTTNQENRWQQYIAMIEAIQRFQRHIAGSSSESVPWWMAGLNRFRLEPPFTNILRTAAIESVERYTFALLGIRLGNQDMSPREQERCRHEGMYNWISELQNDIQKTESEKNWDKNRNHWNIWQFLQQNGILAEYDTPKIQRWREQQTEKFVAEELKMNDMIAQGQMNYWDKDGKMKNAMIQYKKEEMQLILDEVKQQADFYTSAT
jgi:hypothetical protein